MNEPGIGKFHQQTLPYQQQQLLLTFEKSGVTVDSNTPLIVVTVENNSSGYTNIATW